MAFPGERCARAALFVRRRVALFDQRAPGEQSAAVGEETPAWLFALCTFFYDQIGLQFFRVLTSLAFLLSVAAQAAKKERPTHPSFALSFLVPPIIFQGGGK